MQSRKTHEQQMRIIQKRENTANAGKDFDPTPDLKRSAAANEAYRKGQDLHLRKVNDDGNPAIVRGNNQESEHHKNSGGT